MKEFNIEKLVNDLKQELKSALGSKNIIDITVDSRMPSDFIGNPFALTDALKKITTVLAENIVNGILTINFSNQALQGDNIRMLLEVVGNGAPETASSPQYKTIEQIQMGIDAAVTQFSPRCSKEGNRITVFFSTELQKAIDKSGRAISFHDKKILLAEDNQVNVIVFSSFLEEWGARYTVAVNGQEAVESFRAGEYDAILMDIHMPVMSGISAIQEIRKINSRIPIIVLSAVTFQKDIDAALASGANEFLKKPVSSWELYSALVKFF